MFFVLPKCDTQPLEEFFRHKVIKLLVDEGLLGNKLAENMLRWKRSGFSVYKGPVIQRDDREGLEKVCQYIIRNTFNEQKLLYNQTTGMVIYKSKHQRNIKRNFEVCDAKDFIAMLTQHIPNKSFQMVRYYGWYSNKKRGIRKKQSAAQSDPIQETEIDKSAAINISTYIPDKVPSEKWRELIKKIWEIDPLICPQCGSEMSIIALIDDAHVIEKILKHLDIWDDSPSERGPPTSLPVPEVITEPFYDDFQFCPEEYPRHFPSQA